jgi:hypothetical protein
MSNKLILLGVGVVVAILVIGFGFQSYVTMYDGESTEHMQLRMMTGKDDSKVNVVHASSSLPTSTSIVLE